MKDFFITPALSRGARGLIDWQQSELAEQAGLSLTAIKNFESGKKRVHARTLSAIQGAFESHGVAFPISGGVQLIEDITSVIRFSGPDFIQKWNEDIYTAVRHPHEEVLTASVSEELWPKTAASRTYYEWRERMQINTKYLVPEGQKTFNAPLKFYRVVPKEMLGKITYGIYVDRIAFVLWKKRQVIVLRNINVVQTFRAQFLFLWKHGREAIG